jgi:hypothetical protein
MSKPILALVAVGVALLIVVGYWFMPGGGRGQTGPSDYQLSVEAAKDAADALSSQGGRVKEMHYPQGNAWAVNLSGLTLTNKLLEDVQALGKITELDLSKSTVTDDQLDFMSKLGLTAMLLKLDLSNTGVSDAGLEKLENMMLLTQLNLVGTKCTAAGVEKFKRHRASQKKPPIFPTTIKLT